MRLDLQFFTPSDDEDSKSLYAEIPCKGNFIDRAIELYHFKSEGEGSTQCQTVSVKRKEPPSRLKSPLTKKNNTAPVRASGTETDGASCSHGHLEQSADCGEEESTEIAGLPYLITQDLGSDSASQNLYNNGHWIVEQNQLGYKERISLESINECITYIRLCYMSEKLYF